MPFQQYPPCPAHPGIEAAAFTEPFKGETVNGDALFAEEGRADGALMLFLVDVTHHGPSTAATMNTIRDVLGEPASQGLEPAALLQTLHAILALEWDITGKFACAFVLKVRASVPDVVAAKAASPAPWLHLGAGWSGIGRAAHLSACPSLTWVSRMLSRCSRRARRCWHSRTV
jgi:hypothetical protein